MHYSFQPPLSLLPSPIRIVVNQLLPLPTPLPMPAPAYPSASPLKPQTKSTSLGQRTFPDEAGRGPRRARRCGCERVQPTQLKQVNGGPRSTWTAARNHARAALHFAHALRKQPAAGARTSSVRGSLRTS
eukprot:6207688-Pleurochrysis_carterae.AAC.4